MLKQNCFFNEAPFFSLCAVDVSKRKKRWRTIGM